jgi:ABC-type transport system involved in multi-copper enzyme maturation permease subunit
MKARALMFETFFRKRAILIMHLAWLAAYAPLFLIPFRPGTWQWGGFLFAWSGCLLPLALSAGIFGDDIASGRMRLLVTEPVRLSELYLYRFLGLSLQAAVHVWAAGVLILLLHEFTGRGNIDHFALWLLVSWLIFNAWAALSTSVSVVVHREHNAMLVVLATIAVVFPLYMLMLFFADSTGTRIYRGIVRYAGPPVELLVRLGRGKCRLPEGIGSVAYSLLLTAFYSLIGIMVLNRREFAAARD